MNERIKELMLEAGYAAPEIALRAQKLADLVVKECITAATAQPAAKWIGAGVLIEKHFGIK